MKKKPGDTPSATLTEKNVKYKYKFHDEDVWSSRNNFGEYESMFNKHGPEKKTQLD